MELLFNSGIKDDIFIINKTDLLQLTTEAIYKSLFIKKLQKSIYLIIEKNYLKLF